MFKKITSGFLAVLMMVSAFVIVPPQIARAEVIGNYTYIIEGNAVTIIAVAKTIEGAVEIPDKLPDAAGKPVTRIEANAFQDCIKMTSLKIPASIINIVDDPFDGCSALTAFTVDDANTAFSAAYGVLFNKNQTNLIKCPIAKTETTYVIPNTVTAINVWAFFNCSKLTTVTIGTGVETIAVNAFRGCSALTAIVIPNSVRYIDIAAFRGCTSLATVAIGTGTANMGRDVFYGCSGLTAFTVDSANTAFTAVDGVLFNKDKTILINYPTAKADTSYTVPAHVTLIKAQSFYQCEKLTTVVIPDTVITIERLAFVTPTTVKINSNVGSTAYRYAVSNSLLGVSGITTVDNLTMVAPVKGAASTNATTTSQFYDVTTTTWSKDGTDLAVNANFDGGSIYKATVVLTAKTGYEFTASTTTPTGYTKTLGINGSTLTIEQTFPATETNLIISVTITGILDPATNAEQTVATVDTAAQYTATSTKWYKDTVAMGTTDKFEIDNVYKVEILLTAKDGNKFTDATTFADYVKKEMAADGSTLTLEKVFPITQINLIADVVITGILDPVTGAEQTAATVDAAAQYSVTTTKWYRATTAIGTMDKFEVDSVYKVEILLTAKSGNKFTDVTTFTGYTKKEMATDGSTLTLEKVFPITVANSIAAVAITGILDPVTGAEQTAAVVDTAAQYIATTTKWYKAATAMGTMDKFEVGSVYRVEILLTAKTGNKFIDATTFEGYAKKEMAVGGSTLTLEKTFLITEANPISAVAITGIADPVIGDRLSDAVSADPTKYAVANMGTMWSKGANVITPDAKFEAGSEYKVQIILAAEVGNKFIDTTTIPADYTKVAMALDGTTLTIEKSFTSAITKITNVRINNILDPVVGEGQSSATVADATAPYTATTTKWYKGTSQVAMATDVKFEAESIYKVEILLTAKTVNRFTSATAVPTGYTPKGAIDNNRMTLTIEKTFHITGVNPIAAVTVTDILDPVTGAGQTAAAVDTAALYTATTTKWYKGASQAAMANTDKFEAGSVYKVEILLTAKAGNKFTATTTFAGYTKKEMANDGSTLIIEKIFAKTEANPIIAVRVTGLVDPVKGANQTLAVSSDESQYTATTKWYKGASTTPMASTDKFEANSVYKAEILLTARFGYKFTDITATPTWYIKGDMAADGTALTLEKIFTSTKYIDMDMDGDDVITIADALLALKKETTIITANSLANYSNNIVQDILRNIIK